MQKKIVININNKQYTHISSLKGKRSTLTKRIKKTSKTKGKYLNVDAIQIKGGWYIENKLKGSF